jgi:thymidylate synthase (FAD)
VTVLTSKIKARRIETPDSELKIVNAARVSFAKESTELSDGDVKLLRYLALHRHWTPFSHVRDTFSFSVKTDSIKLDLLQFFMFELSQEDTASIVYAIRGSKIYVRTSLFGWANILNKFVRTGKYRGFISQFGNVYLYLVEKYPNAINFLCNEHATELFEEYGPVFGDCDELDDPYFKDITLCETVPIFVARQRFKHMVGTTYNEVSRRYVSTTPEIYFPTEWRGTHENKKQGSTDEAALWMHDDNNRAAIAAANIESCVTAYDQMIANSVCPEQTRLILPQGMMTEYYVTANVAAWNRFIEQRLDSHAQKEIQDLAKLVQLEITK